MPDDTTNPYDAIEAAIELAAESDEFGDWYARYQHTLDAANTFPESLDYEERIAIEHIAGLTGLVGDGVRCLLYRTRYAAYDEGLRDGLVAANESDDEEPDDPGCCVP